MAAGPQRLVLDDGGLRFVLEGEGCRVDLRVEDDEATLAVSTPVSYTHLDVYKRQALGTPDPPSMLSLIHIFVHAPSMYRSKFQLMASAVSRLVSVAPRARVPGPRRRRHAASGRPPVARFRQ